MFINKTNDGLNNVCGKNIAKLRGNMKISQRKLADKMQLVGIDIDKNAIQRIECGKRFVTDIEIIAFSKVFDVTFDELIKGDPAFVRETDENKRRMAKNKRWIWILLIVILLMASGMAWFLTHVGVGTDDGERIQSETSVKMVVNLPGQNPSRAITRTYIAAKFDALSAFEQMEKLAETTGNVEGDIPCTRIDKRGKSEICLVFQDRDYNDINPEVKDVTIFTSPGLPPEITERTDKEFDYQYVDGQLRLYATDFLEEQELTFGKYTGDEGDITYVMVCYFLVRYVYEGEAYVSMTAVDVLPS